jgi:hypothetical protein
MRDRPNNLQMYRKVARIKLNAVSGFERDNLLITNFIKTNDKELLRAVQQSGSLMGNLPTVLTLELGRTARAS